jgi:hypothetical protein
MRRMFVWRRYQPRSLGDGAAGAAEQRWLLREAELIRRFAYTAIGIAASLVATWNCSAASGEL